MYKWQDTQLEAEQKIVSMLHEAHKVFLDERFRCLRETGSPKGLSTEERVKHTAIVGLLHLRTHYGMIGSTYINSVHM